MTSDEFRTVGIIKNRWCSAPLTDYPQASYDISTLLSILRRNDEVQEKLIEACRAYVESEDFEPGEPYNWQYIRKDMRLKANRLIRESLALAERK